MSILNIKISTLLFCITIGCSINLGCSNTKNLQKANREIGNSLCADSLITKTFEYSGYRKLETTNLILSEKNRLGVVDELIQLNGVLAGKEIDVNDDIVKQTEKMAKALSPTKGYIRSIDTCEDFLEFKSFIDSGKFKERNESNLYLTEVITTKRLDDKDILWVLLSVHW